MKIRPEEWIREPDEDGNGFLEGWMVSGDTEYPIPIETHNVSINDVRLGEVQDFKFILECAEKPEVYLSEDEYMSGKELPCMGAESVIPAGLFPPKEDDDFVMSPTIILSGRVIEIFEDSSQYSFRESDILFTLSCLGNELDVVLPAEYAEDIQIKKGYIVSGLYWVQGWPDEDLGLDS